MQHYLDLEFLSNEPQYEIRLRNNENQIIKASISENRQYLATNHTEKIIKLWDLKNKKIIKDIELMTAMFLTLFEFSHDSQIFFYAQFVGFELNMVYLNNRDLIQKSINIQDYIGKVLFNQNNSQAVIVHNNNQNYIFSIWNIIEQQKEFQIKIQNLVVNSLYLDNKKFLIVSQEQDLFTHFSIYSTDQQKMINQWRGKYIRNHMNLHYDGDNQFLVVDYYFEYELHIQIWSLHNFNLIKHIHDEISSFDPLKFKGNNLMQQWKLSEMINMKLMMVLLKIQMIIYCKMNG